MKDYNTGDIIEIISNQGTFSGKVMPSINKDYLMLKLDSGYNIGFKIENIKEIKLIKKYEKENLSENNEFFNPSLPTISILHTGGTIASKVDYNTGAVIARFTPSELNSMFPELNNIANIKSRLMRNMWSDDMRFSHYNLMAEEIKKEIKDGAKGIIITHGTDTLHYTASALSFIFRNIKIPIILVGAQRSSDRGSSDAAINFIAATNLISNSDFAGVAICMHKTSDDEDCILISGANARKMHTSRRDAFKSINNSPIAVISRSGEIKFLKEYNKISNHKIENLELFNEKLKIGILYIHPNMYEEEFKAYENFDGLVLVSTGLGHAPISEIDEFTAEHTKIKNAIKNLAKKIPIVNCAQSIYGRIDMNVYSPGRELKEIGVLGHLSNMTIETTFIKLAWLISNKYNVKENIMKDYIGELNYCSEFEK